MSNIGRLGRCSQPFQDSVGMDKTMVPYSLVLTAASLEWVRAATCFEVIARRHCGVQSQLSITGGGEWVSPDNPELLSPLML